jgi:pyruvate dehydrogenase E1 component alpha subunit
MSAPNGQAWLDVYTSMLRIRLFEEQVNDLYLSAKMPGLAHLYIGEEAVAVGVCTALRDDDYITSTHRGHGHCLAKGASVDRMFAELLGKEAGYCKGKGGSMHIADQEKGNLGANAIVAGSVGIATGAALSAKKRGTDQVAACFFGEGALGQGILYECMNMASLWKLPVIYICENNLYNEYTHYLETTAGDIAQRAPSASPSSRSTGKTFAKSSPRRRNRSSALAPARGLHSWSCAPTVSGDTMSATSTGPTTAPKKKSRNGHSGATRSRSWRRA